MKIQGCNLVSINIFDCNVLVKISHMKIICPICGKNIPRFELVLVHMKRVHPELSPDKALELALNAQITDISRRNDKRVISTLNREKQILLGRKIKYKKRKPHSIYWGAVIKTPCGSK